MLCVYASKGLCLDLHRENCFVTFSLCIICSAPRRRGLAVSMFCFPLLVLKSVSVCRSYPQTPVLLYSNMRATVQRSTLFPFMSALYYSLDKKKHCWWKFSHHFFSHKVEIMAAVVFFDVIMSRTEEMKSGSPQLSGTKQTGVRTWGAGGFISALFEEAVLNLK